MHPEPQPRPRRPAAPARLLVVAPSGQFAVATYELAIQLARALDGRIVEEPVPMRG